MLHACAPQVLSALRKPLSSSDPVPEGDMYSTAHSRFHSDLATEQAFAQHRTASTACIGRVAEQGQADNATSGPNEDPEEDAVGAPRGHHRLRTMALRVDSNTAMSYQGGHFWFPDAFAT